MARAILRALWVTGDALGPRIWVHRDNERVPERPHLRDPHVLELVTGGEGPARPISDFLAIRS
jgi:hypothetical protein